MRGMNQLTASLAAAGLASGAIGAEAAQAEQTPQHIAPTQEVTQIAAPNILDADAVINIKAVPQSDGGFSLAHSAQTPQSPDILKSVTVTFTNDGKRNSSSTMSDIAESKVTVLENFKAKGLPKKVVKKLERQGKCETVDGTETEVWTAGHDTNSMTKYGRDYRVSEFCKYAGRWVRVKCGNPAKIEKKPPVTMTIPGKVIFVNNIAKTSAKLHAEATADASCQVAGATASAKGSASADSTVSLNTVIKTAKGGADSVAVKLYETAYQRASAKAMAEAHCDTTDNGGNTPPPPEAPKPGVTVENLQHLGVNMVARVCEFETAPSGETIVRRNFSIPSGGINIVSNIYPGPDQGEFCIDVKGSAVASDGNVVRATVEASNGTTASDDSEPFPVVASPQLPQ